MKKPESSCCNVATGLISVLALSLMTACAGEAPHLAATPVFSGCPVETSELAANTASPSLPRPGCSEDASIYSPIVWLPLFGPLYDAATNTHAERETGLSLLATLLPGIGPAIQTGVGVRQCLVKCLPPVDASSLPAGDGRDYLMLALEVSDDNCRRFLNELPAALEDAEADGAPLRLVPLLADTIRTERLLARKYLENSPQDTAELPARLDAYDALCSADHALATLTDAGHNQLGGNASSNALDNRAWLAQNGFSDAATTNTATQNTDGKTGNSGKRTSHINRINRPDTAKGYQNLLKKGKKP